MPHINIEYTQSISSKCSMPQLLKKLHTCLAEHETIKLQSIKSRALAFDNVILGDESHDEFMHVNVLLLKGRSEELKQLMAQNLFNSARSFLADEKISLSVNVAELGAYAK